MAIKTIMDSTLTAIADAIRAKTGKSAAMTPLEMPTEIGSISGGGGNLANDLMAGTASGNIVFTISNNLPGIMIRITPQRNGLNQNIESIEINGLTSLSSSPIAFANGDTDYNNLRSVRLPDVVTAGNFGGNYTHYIDNLIEFYAPKLQGTGQRFLKNAIRLPEFHGDSILRMQSESFSGCSALEYVDLGKAWVGTTITGTNAIEANSFLNTALKALVLRQDSQAIGLSMINALSGTPIASGTGYIYVPRALKTTYESATNWTTYSTQFRALEDYTSDGTLTGDFVMPSA